ncbi:MAG: hypothetical protein GY851_16680 [bacterium]|nr:hypothetical protein [bacterium]
MISRLTIALVCVMSFVAAPNCFAGEEETVLTDLAARVDAGRLSDVDRDAWRALPYESELFAGTMLGEGGGVDIPPMPIGLGQEGVYRIHLGLYCGYGNPVLRLRLTGDEEAQTVKVPAELHKETVHNSSVIVYEATWKDADLTGRDLILESARSTSDFPAALAYIRLEPLDKVGGEPLSTREAPSKPVRGLDPTRKVAYPMAITEDGHGIFGESLHATPEDLIKPFEAIPEGSCLRMVLWGNGEADNCNYPTKVGNEREYSGFHTEWYQRWNQNVENWKQDGWDSLKTMTTYAKGKGLELQVYIRMQAFTSPFPFDKMVHSHFFEAHPEFHCLDRHGQRLGRLSYAYPEVQDHMLALTREISEYDPDGICYCFIRGLPMVHYEPVMVEGFTKKYGVDPRELGETDERWLTYQGEVMTAYMRKARAVLKPGQRLSAIVPSNRHDCERWGLDVATWVREGIIDDLYPTGQVFSDRDVHLDDPDNLDFTYFNNLEGRDRIRLMPLLYPWTKFNSDFEGWRADMRSFLEQGADGYVAWDSRGHVARIGDIGYEQTPESGDAVPGAVPIPKKLYLKTLQGIRMDRYHHFEVI